MVAWQTPLVCPYVYLLKSASAGEKAANPVQESTNSLQPVIVKFVLQVFQVKVKVRLSKANLDCE